MNVGFQWNEDNTRGRLILPPPAAGLMQMWYAPDRPAGDLEPDEAYGYYQGRTLTHVLLMCDVPYAETAYAPLIEVNVEVPPELPQWLRHVLYTLQHQGVSLPDTGTS